MRTTFDPASGRFGPLEADVQVPTEKAKTINGKSFIVPSLESRHVILRTIAMSDYEFLQAAELDGDLAVRWRFAGGTPSPEQWLQRTWSGVLAQHLVIERRTMERVGLTSCYQADFQHGHAYIAATRLVTKIASPRMIVGLALFVRYVLTCWDFRKLYMELPEYNLAQFASGEGSIFDIEGRLKDHYFHGGQHWDQLTLAVYRERALDACERMLAGVNR